MRIFWHKVTHWEYWPVYIIYMPTFFIWVWWMIRFRSLQFYKYSNPVIKNGGFYGDSKMDIYKLLPKEIYPKTEFIKIDNASNYQEIIAKNHFTFPLIAKPDIGCRGVGVEQVNDIAQLIAYEQKSKSDFLIQEMVSYPNEIGLFYCRIPNQKEGKITGITLKKFLTLEGNGKKTIEELLKKTKRYEMQVAKLKDQIDITEIIPLGVEKCIVPFGNHNRGTLFLDGKEFITNSLEKTLNNLLNNIDGFYFGRLDIRFNTFEELEQGKNFSIIEINGAKSEPTHIYSPEHSFWFGQREIFRHQIMMKNVINQVYSS